MESLVTEGDRWIEGRVERRAEDMKVWRCFDRLTSVVSQTHLHSYSVMQLSSTGHPSHQKPSIVSTDLSIHFAA